MRIRKYNWYLIIQSECSNSKTLEVKTKKFLQKIKNTKTWTTGNKKQEN